MFVAGLQSFFADPVVFHVGIVGMQENVVIVNADFVVQLCITSSLCHYRYLMDTDVDIFVAISCAVLNVYLITYNFALNSDRTISPA